MEIHISAKLRTIIDVGIFLFRGLDYYMVSSKAIAG